MRHQPTLNFVDCTRADAKYRMAYWQWGDAASDHVVLCVHGLTRQGRDFDVLAQALCDSAPGKLRVVCPDVLGRGQSDWLKDPVDYQVPLYAGDMLALVAQLQPKTLDWVGTSMGGLIGMEVAGQAHVNLSSPIRKFILNDIGPVIEWPAIQRIIQYLGKVGQFDSVQQAADALWAVSSSFGPHTQAQWLALSQAMVKPSVSGTGYSLHYDPAIAIPFASATEEVVKQSEAGVWARYDAITAQTLVTRGALSDVLSVETAHAMRLRGPKASVIEFSGVGHAPTFIEKSQVKAVVDFLL